MERTCCVVCGKPCAPEDITCNDVNCIGTQNMMCVGTCDDYHCEDCFMYNTDETITEHMDNGSAMGAELLQPNWFVRLWRKIKSQWFDFCNAAQQTPRELADRKRRIARQHREQEECK